VLERVDPRLPDRLIRDELFDLSLYQALRRTADGELARVLDELIRVETRHFAFWQEFFGRRVDRLDAGRRLQLALLRGLCRLFGRPAVHLVLEAIEVYGVRKYLSVWDTYRGEPLGEAVRGILEDEFRHEDAIVTGVAERRISPARIRNIFLGLNDGLVEIVGAVSGFFAAFSEAGTVLVAGSTVAVAGALSMAAGAYVAASSEAEVRRTEEERRRFLASADDGAPPAEPDEQPLAAAGLVGFSYLAGALIPVLPVLLGARTAWPSLLTAGTVMVLVSMLLAFLSGMDVRRRILTNVLIMAIAVGVTYGIGVIARAFWGVSI
jgi:VIT1/CCC1 family predicted Fe2+/Mn2+ transporter